MTRKQLQPRQEVSRRRERFLTALSTIFQSILSLFPVLAGFAGTAMATNLATSLMTNESDALVPLMGIYRSLEALLQEASLSGELDPERNAFTKENTKHLTDLPYRALKQTLCLKPRKLGSSLYHTVFCYILERYLSRPQNLTLCFPPASATAFVYRGGTIWKAVNKRALLLDVLNFATVSLTTDFSKKFSLGLSKSKHDELQRHLLDLEVIAAGPSEGVTAAVRLLAERVEAAFLSAWAQHQLPMALAEKLQRLDPTKT